MVQAAANAMFGVAHSRAGTVRERTTSTYGEALAQLASGRLSACKVSPVRGSCTKAVRPRLPGFEAEGGVTCRWCAAPPVAETGHGPHRPRTTLSWCSMT